MTIRSSLQFDAVWWVHVQRGPMQLLPALLVNTRHHIALHSAKFSWITADTWVPSKQKKTSFFVNWLESGSDWSDPVTSLEHPSPQITGSAKKLRSDWDSDQRLFDLELIKEVWKSSISEFKFLYSREHSAWWKTSNRCKNPYFFSFQKQRVWNLGQLWPLEPQ